MPKKRQVPPGTDVGALVESMLDEVVRSALPKLDPGPDFERAKLCLRYFYKFDLRDLTLKVNEYMCKDGNGRQYFQELREFHTTVIHLARVYSEYAEFKPVPDYIQENRVKQGLPVTKETLICRWFDGRNT